MKCDFKGWATRNDLRCADGRTIRRDAFKDNDGKTLPLVWNHQHGEVSNILGHAILENRPEGVYAYATFNETEDGKLAKELVKHGDIEALSIWANNLKQNGGDVLHGIIREVSLVLAGANPGAYIESVMAHGDGSDEEALICTGDVIELYHSDEDETVPAEDNNDPPKDATLEHAATETKPTKGDTSMAETKPTSKPADNAPKDGEETIQDVFNTLDEKQKTVVYAMIGQALEDAGADNNGGGDTTMKHNLFDNDVQDQENVISHDALMEAIGDAKRCGSMRDSFIQHGIDNVDYLFPEAQAVSPTPDFISRRQEWVAGVINGVHHTPFSRIKSMQADITEDEARAKGYIKGKYKKEEVFSLLKRTTTPQTVYKKQKMDRDDVIDITDFDVVAWLKAEMRGQLDEELGRAILVGDGRLASDDDHINELNIRPIWKDEDLYTIKEIISVSGTATDADKATAFIDHVIKSRKNYRGSGNPTLYASEDMITSCLLLKDTLGHFLYKSEVELATTLRVSSIVSVPVMENLTRTADSKIYTLAALIVNLNDYNVGADKGGAVNMFDDFDIDYNQQKYLSETRCSGALVKPYSAIAVEFTTAAG